MVDYLLAAVLILVLPIRSLRQSLRPNPSDLTLMQKYLKTTLYISALLILLAYIWISRSLPLAELGLDIPLSAGGLTGMMILGVLVVLAILSQLIWLLKVKKDNSPHPDKKPDMSVSLPGTRSELVAFMLVSVLLGCGWELLYRGFVLWFLAPQTGIIAAVIIAALAYGIGHGFKTRGQFIGSIISAFLFTIAFALSGSLWWLMIIHTALPVVMGVTYYRSVQGKIDQQHSERSGKNI